jgi:hypothetical protein
VSDFRPDRDNLDDEALRQRLNQELTAMLDEPQFQSRKTSIMAQIRAEQTSGAPNSSASQPNRIRWFFNAPTWAGAMAAVFALVFVGVLFAVISGNVNQNAALVSFAGTPAPAATTAAIAATTAPAPVAAASDAARNSIGESAGGSAPAQGTGVPATTAAAVTAALAAPVATTAAPARPTTAPASATTAAATTAASLPTLVALPPTAATTAPAGAGVTNSVTLLPNETPLPNITGQQAETYVTNLLATRSNQEKATLRLNPPNTYNYSVSKLSSINITQAISLYNNRYPSPVFNTATLVLQDNTQLKIQVITFSQAANNAQIEVVYLLEPRQAGVLNSAFGAGVVNVGETLLISARPK